MAENRDFKGVWIPKEIWLSEELNLQEKCLLVEIDSLSSLGKCYASNDHFAKFLRLSKDRISKMISSLRDKGYVEVMLTYKPGSKEIDERIITTIGYRQKQLEGIVENNDTPIGKSNNTPIVKNAKENNTVFNNTVFNNTHTEKGNKSKKNNVCVELASQIETVIGQGTTPEVVKSLLKKADEETVKHYISIWDKYKGFEADSNNPLSWFIHCVSTKRPVPQPKTNNSYNNGKETFRDFDQREYEEKDFEKYYANLQDN